jgi:hypothetical protein
LLHQDLRWRCTYIINTNAACRVYTNANDAILDGCTRDLRENVQLRA